jgi:hypothetical protein
VRRVLVVAVDVLYLFDLDACHPAVTCFVQRSLQSLVFMLAFFCWWGAADGA